MQLDHDHDEIRPDTHTLENKGKFLIVEREGKISSEEDVNKKIKKN